MAVAPKVNAVRKRFRASLTLLHVIHMPAAAYGTIEAPITCYLTLDEVKESAHARLLEFAARAFPDEPVTTVVEMGDPGSCIPELVRDNNIDLVMMPTRGHGRFRAALLGSVTAKTLHDATCAVWTDCHREDSGPEHLEWKSVICAVDTEAEGAHLIRVAAGLAANSPILVSLVHAVPAQDRNVERLAGTEFTAFLKDRARETIAGMQREAGTNFGVCVEAGSLCEVVRHAAESHKADLVLIGRGLLPRFAGGLRSHAYSIVRDMPCPVLSV
jgi:nucleotide-binding universal stress UspA family protein